ncbi:transglutaminase family protein [soil metagenome]
MKFQVHSELTYEVQQPSTLILSIQALRTPGQTVLEENLEVEPYIRVEEISSATSTHRFTRMEVTEPLTFTLSYRATVDVHYQEIDHDEKLGPVPVVQLDADVIPFLFPSRYCQSDKLQRLAYNKFGQIGNPYLQVLAITDWIYDNVEYLSGSSNSQTSAFDTVTERVGVCRDFAHLGIAMCRALSIPARYFTGYSFKLDPPDFHACFEAYIGGHWIIFDATRLAPLNGLVKIATSRDAADAAVATTFGNVSLQSIRAGCEAVDKGFKPFWNDKNSLKGLSYQ